MAFLTGLGVGAESGQSFARRTSSARRKDGRTVTVAGRPRSTGVCRMETPFDVVVGGGGSGRPPKVGRYGRDGRGGDGEGSDDGELEFTPVAWLMSLWTAYLKALESRPVLVKSLSAGILACIGDGLAQYLESGRKGVSDFRRLVSIGLTAGLVVAPMFHYLYEYMEHRIPVATGKKNVALQLIVDQLVAAPLYIPLFYGFFGTFEGKDHTSIRAQIHRDFWPTLKLTWYVFPIVQLLNFTLLPLQTRILTLNVVDIFFTGAISAISHR